MPDLALSDQNAPVLARNAFIGEGHDEHLWQSFLNSLSGVDVLDFFNLVPELEGRPNPLYQLSDTTVDNGQFMLDLATEEKVKIWRQKSVFKKARANARKLANAGVEFRIPTQPDERVALCEKLIAYKKARFKAQGVDNLLSCQVMAGLYKDLAEATGDRQAAQLFSLEKDGEIVAATMVMLSRRTVNGVLLSIGGPEWHRMSPGFVLVSKVIDWAQENGFERFCLGTGAQQYKGRFGGDLVETKKLSRAVTYAGDAYILARSLKDLAGQIMRNSIGNKADAL
ncbi:GNAT family N-acetyltransferase [Roseibium sp.]|uniref:GNAT family N-acetyltransferase n=1 Tax=Roseibium sp. TaxID=1936156 RepID=UPI003A971251